VRTPFLAKEMGDRLLARGVLVKDVSRPGLLDRCLRITVGTAAENERCARAIEEAIARLSPSRSSVGAGRDVE